MAKFIVIIKCLFITFLAASILGEIAYVAYLSGVRSEDFTLFFFFAFFAVAVSFIVFVFSFIELMDDLNE